MKPIYAFWRNTKPPQRRIGRFRGFTLGELLVVLGILAVFIPLSTGTIVAMLEFHVRFSERTDASLNTDRLFLRFRDDVSRYGTPQIVSDETILAQWKLPDGELSYTLVAGEFPGRSSLRRLRHVEGNTSEFDTFRLPEHSRLWCYEGTNEHAGNVALSLWSDVPHTQPPHREDLDPFTRTVSEALAKQTDPAYAGNWRTVIVTHRK